MNLTKLKVAVIGYGYWGPNIVRNFSKNPDCIVTNIIDYDQSRLDTAKRDYPNITMSKNIKKIISKGSKK